MAREEVKTEVLVVGGGAVGVSVARYFALAGRQVILIDSEATPGSVNSSRNSGVIHAGLYYANSPKKKNCVSVANTCSTTTAERKISHFNSRASSS